MKNKDNFSFSRSLQPFSQCQWPGNCRLASSGTVRSSSGSLSPTSSSFARTSRIGEWSRWKPLCLLCCWKPSKPFVLGAINPGGVTRPKCFKHSAKISYYFPPVGATDCSPFANVMVNSQCGQQLLSPWCSKLLRVLSFKRTMENRTPKGLLYSVLVTKMKCSFYCLLYFPHLWSQTCCLSLNKWLFSSKSIKKHFRNSSPK